MKLFKIFLFSLLMGLSYEQGLRGFFDTLAFPFNDVSEGVKKLLNPIANLPDDEKLDKENCKCRLKVNSFIIGGEQSETIAWQVALIFAKNSSLFCGGTIINRHYILTAAHCIIDKNPEDIQIKVGIANLKDDDPFKKFDVHQIFHDSYTSTREPGDIAILKLAEPLEFEFGSIEPGCLNVVRKENYDGELMATGFGTTSHSYQENGVLYHGNYSDILKKAFFYQDKTNCKNFLICINSKNGDSPCMADSGGPLHFNTDHGPITTIEGVASFVRAKGDIKERILLCTGFAGYSRLSFYSNWIESIVGKEYCTKETVSHIKDR